MKRAVVTGAGGFIGCALVRHLEREGWSVDAWSRAQWNLQDPVPDARLLGVDAVFHVAAKVGEFGRPADFEAVNVSATAALITACEERGVRAFVYTSTPSVVMADKDLQGVDEHTPLAATPLNDYARSKARAELAVRAHAGRLRTIALRPHAVVGPEDRHLVPLCARLARLPVVPRIGDGRNLVHFTSLATTVRAHARAAEVLLSGAGHGQAVFVADGPPLPLWEVLAALWRRWGARPRLVEVPWSTAWQMARAAEWFHAPMPWWPPVITRYRVAMLGRSHWFDLRRMSQLLGIAPGDAHAAINSTLEAQ